MNKAFALFIVLYIWPFTLCHSEIRLGQETTVIFATVEQGKQILKTRDDFVRSMSPFDRAARMKIDKDVSEEQFITFVCDNVLTWDESEKHKVESALHGLQPRFSALSLPFPKNIYMIKTTGKEEGDAAYTRSNAIVLPCDKITTNEYGMQALICHELFHILSRHNPKLRDRLYEAIGFIKCDELEFPDKLKPIKLTNPDAPNNDHCIRVRAAGDMVWVVPIIFSVTEKYNAERGGEFFDYLQFGLLAVERIDDSPKIRPIYYGSRLKLMDMRQIRGFFEQVGRNTDYIIHPEEILADNFALLVMGQKIVRSPEILKTMEKALK